MSLTTEDKFEVREIVREETDDMRQDIRHLGVLIEDVHYKVDKIVEFIDADTTRQKVDRHELEIQNLKSDMRVVKSAIKQKP